MFARAYDLVALTWPLILCGLFIICAIFAPALAARSGKLKIQVAGFIFDQGIPASMVRIIFIVIAALLFVLPGFRDYSVFFPERLALTAFFDNAGIERYVETLAKSDLVRLNIAPDWKSKKQEYFAKLNLDLSKYNLRFRFSEFPGQTYSKGEVKFRTKMIDKWGAQLYRIVEANGSLLHTTQLPGAQSVVIKSEFQLVETDGVIIDASWSDVYLRHGILIRPEFKQIIRISPTQEFYYGSLIAATRVDVFPYVNISKTLYLLRDQQGKNVPIGYAFYSQL